jgi:hypothetical protein
MSTKVKLNYVITNNGDGSASVHFVKNNMLAEIYDDFQQALEGWGEGEAFEKELEFDEHGELLDKYCVDVKEALEQRIAHQWTNERYPDHIEDCKKWLAKIKTAENNKEKYKKKKGG